MLARFESDGRDLVLKIVLNKIVKCCTDYSFEHAFDNGGVQFESNGFAILVFCRQGKYTSEGSRRMQVEHYDVFWLVIGYFGLNGFQENLQFL